MIGTMLRCAPRLVRQGARDLFLHPWAQAFTMLTVALLVFLGGLMLMLLTTVDRSLSASRDETVIQIYWKTDVDEAVLRPQWDQIVHMPWLVRYTTYTPDQALTALASRMGREVPGLDLSFLKGKNPLPPSALLHFEPEEADYAVWLAETRKHLETLPGVDAVVMSPLQTEMGRSWRLLSHRIMLPALALLSLLLALIVGNTVRLSLVSRAAEIEILQLVGAENWYIRLPLLAGGSLVGLLGGAIGLGLTWLVWMWLAPFVHFPPLLPELVFPPWRESLFLALVPMIMGALGSFLAVRTRMPRPER